jgi:hypothetical protein
MPYPFFVRRFGQRREPEFVWDTTDHIAKEGSAEQPGAGFLKREENASQGGSNVSAWTLRRPFLRCERNRYRWSSWRGKPKRHC